MPDPLAGTQFTDMWMQNPWGMTQADQLSNQFSNFNNKPFPFPPTYNTDAAAGGGPTDAMGRPIQSFQNWLQANPAGTTINNTPTQQIKTLQDMTSTFTPLQQQWWSGAPANEKQQAMDAYGVGKPWTPPGSSSSGSSGGGGGTQQAQTSGAGQPQSNFNAGSAYNSASPNMSQGIYSAGSPNGMGLTMGQRYPLSSFAAPGTYGNQNQADASGLAALMGLNPQRLNGVAPQAAAPQQQPQQQTNAAPNNWQAAIDALANPGNPVTRGATVAPVTGYQPAGGVNNAFLQNAQGRPGMNQNFLSALAAIQGRPQQQAAAMPQQQMAAMPQQQQRRWG